MTQAVSPTSPATVSLADLRQLGGVAIQRHPEQRARVEHAAMIVALRRVQSDAGADHGRAGGAGSSARSRRATPPGS